MNIIEMDHAVRFFGAVPAVVDMSLTVSKGSVFGLLGENGSGKTTSIKLMMGALIPQEGTVRVFDVGELGWPNSLEPTGPCPPSSALKKSGPRNHKKVLTDM